MGKHEIAAVGDAASVLVFRAAGVETVFAENPAEAERAVRALAAEGCRVIFVTERLLEQLPDLAAHYRRTAYPAVISIPGRDGPTGYGAGKIAENMEKAIGTSLLQ